MSRKSMDSAFRSSMRRLSSRTSETSRPSASAIACATRGNTVETSSLVTCIYVAVLPGLRPPAPGPPAILVEPPGSFQLEASIDGKDLPRDVARVARCQEEDRARDVLRLAEPPEEDPRQNFRPGALADLPGHVRLDDARRHGVHGDAPRRELDREGAREGVQGALARGIGRLASPAPLASDRAHEHDLAAPAADHVRDHGPGDVDRAEEVRVDDVAQVPVLEPREEAVADDAARGDEDSD